MSTFTILATDLDGTFLPLLGHPENHDALRAFDAAFGTTERRLIFATGRHLESVEDAIRQVPLPRPHWIIADVGVTINVCKDDGWESLEAYQEHLRDATAGQVPQEMDPLFAQIHGLRRQPEASQKPFKLSYDCAPGDLTRITEAIEAIIENRELPLACTSSVDPAGETGLIDLLPAAASKFAALLWLLEFEGIPQEAVIFAGDSGNDRSALTSDLHAIIVGNATPSLAEQVRMIREAKGQGDRLYVARAAATSGVLEGCRHFGLVP